MAEYRYIQITEEKFYGIVMRLGDIGDQWYWDVKKQEWVKTGLYIRYTLQEDMWDMYEEIPLAMALKIIGEQK